MDPSKLFDLTGKRAVGLHYIIFRFLVLTIEVTGGATGIGLMCTQALSRAGATVYIVGRRQAKLDQAVKHYGNESDPSIKGSIVGIAGDITSKEGLQKLADRVQQLAPNGINILVNNAGIARDLTKYSSDGTLDKSDRLSPSRATYY